jgi:hypothetical protein
LLRKSVKTDKWNYTQQEKVFGSFSLGKGSMSRIYKELQKFNTRANNPITKWEMK